MSQTPSRMATDTTINSFENYLHDPSPSLLTSHRLEIREYPDFDDHASDHEPSEVSDDANKNNDASSPDKFDIPND